MKSLRDEFLLNPNVVFLNHGSFGATPRRVFDCYQRWQRELETQPVEFLGRRFNELMHESRTALSTYLGTSAENLVFIPNATTGINAVARSLALRPGDEVLSTDHEYGAMDRTWKFMSRKKGFSYKRQTIPLPVTTAETFADQIWEGVTEFTRVIFLSHITSPSALILPIEKIIQRAHEHGIITVIDGAHAPGQLHFSLDKLGADFYTGNLHKWLCAPKGAAFLYARPEVQELVEPLVVSWGWESDTPGPSRFVDYYEWTGTRDISAYLTVPEAIRFQKEHDWDKVRVACHHLAQETRTALSTLTALPPIQPDSESWYAQMVAAGLPSKVNPEDLKTKLYDQYRIEVPVHEFNGHNLIRVSYQGYNDEGDQAALLSALSQLL